MRHNWLKTLMAAVVAGSLGVVGGIAVAAQFELGVGAVAQTVEPSDGNDARRGTGAEDGPISIRMNEAGQTYGQIGDGTEAESIPDLILAIGNRGVEGYVKAEELFQPPPSGPAEAFVRTTAQRGDRTIPVYDESGDKVIDTFTIQGTG